MLFNNCKCGALKPKHTPLCVDCTALVKKKKDAHCITIVHYGMDSKTGQHVQGKYIEHMGYHYIYDADEVMHPVDTTKLKAFIGDREL